jgi:hypothetical protein
MTNLKRRYPGGAFRRAWCYVDQAEFDVPESFEPYLR